MILHVREPADQLYARPTGRPHRGAYKRHASDDEIMSTPIADFRLLIMHCIKHNAGITAQGICEAFGIRKNRTPGVRDKSRQRVFKSLQAFSKAGSIRCIKKRWYAND